LLKLFGIPVRIDPSFLVLTFVLAGSRSYSPALLIEWLLVILFSILIHELGHAFAGRRFGLSPSIKIYSMGGLTSWTNTVELSPIKHLLISLAGPAAGFLLGGLLLILDLVVDINQSDLLRSTYYDLLWANIGWGIFNLLPVLPMDGGQILVTLESWITGRRDQIAARIISLSLAFCIAGLAITKGQFWIGLLGFWFAYDNGSFLFHKFREKRDEKLYPTLAQASEAVNRSEFDRALELIATLRNQARTGWYQREVSRLTVFILIRQHRFDEAEEELHKFDTLHGGDPYLTVLLDFEKGPTAETLPRLRAVFVESPSRQIGLLLYQALINEKRFVEVLELASDESLAEERWKLCANVQMEAFNSGDFGVSARAGLLVYELHPDADLIYNLVCAFARDGKSEEALHWLRVAMDAGLDNKEALASDPDLESIRSDPWFKLVSNQ